MGTKFNPPLYRLLPALALLAAFLIPDGTLDHTPVFCPFRMATGLPCPTCGLTRSWVAFMHGHLRESFAYHPFGPLTAIVAIILVLGIHRRFPEVARRLQSRPVVGALIGVWVAVWLVRLRLAWY